MSIGSNFSMITGASSGIGAAYADRLAAKGQNLILIARRQTRLEALAEAIRRTYNVTVETITADLATDEGCATIEHVLHDRSDINMLVNSAGLGALGLTKDVPFADLERLIRVNILALTCISRAALIAFLSRNNGNIVNIGSIVAFRAAHGAAAYSGSKAYVLNFSRSLQLEAIDSNVKVQVVLPGPVKTEFFSAAGGEPVSFPEKSFVSVGQLVDAALLGLEQNELVCIPTLQASEEWLSVARAQSALREAAGAEGKIATRYGLIT